MLTEATSALDNLREDEEEQESGAKPTLAQRMVLFVFNNQSSCRFQHDADPATGSGALDGRKVSAHSRCSLYIL